MDPLLILFGLGVGILVGATGIGGGSLMTPLLILLFGIKPVVAVGTDLAYAAVTKTVGGFKHWRQHTVDARLSSWMALGSVPAAIGGVYVLTLLEDWLGRDFEDVVIAILAGEPIRPVAPGDVVVAGTAQDRVVAVTAAELVASGAPVDRVVPRLGADVVAPATPIDHVIAGAAQDDVALRRPHDPPGPDDGRYAAEARLLSRWTHLCGSSRGRYQHAAGEDEGAGQ